MARKARAGRAWLEAQGAELPLRLTLLCLLLAPVGAWYVRPFVLVIAAAGLLSGGVLRSAWTWFALAFLTGLRAALYWPLSDNHAYLLFYWCLAIALFRALGSPSAELARSARLMIGLVMALAILWKAVLAPDFVDGRFFRTSFLTDGRFAAWAELAGMDDASLEQAAALLERNRHEPEPMNPSQLETPALRRVALLATWATLAIEGATALLFLLPARLRLARWRDAALLAFCATTYAVAPVPGFGWILLAMGVAQTPPASRVRWLYLACFALVVLHDHVPWAELARPLVAAMGPSV